MIKTGLVLSGGGAKGAYQAGLVQALVESNVAIDAIAGASIGALNGGVLVSAPDLQTGAQRLQQLWEMIPKIKPLQRHEPEYSELWKIGAYLTLLVSSGLVMRSTPVGTIAVSLLQLLKGKLNISQSLHNLSGYKDNSLFTDKPLQEMMNLFLDINHMQQSIPLYVSVFRQENPIMGILDIMRAELLGQENQGSVFKHIQSLPQDAQKEILLASAALPFLFKSRRDDDGTRLTDGGQGGWIKAQGNTPIQPLIEAGCDYVIVSHLNKGSLWHRKDFPNTTIMEIRPNPKLDLGMDAMLDFSSEKIATLYECGYQDTLAQLGQIKNTLDTLQRKRAINQEVSHSLKQLDHSEAAMDNAMNLLK